MINKNKTKKNGDGIEEGEEGKREGGERGEEILAHGRAGGHTNQRWYKRILLNLPKTLYLNSPQELLAHGGNCQNPIGSVKIELK